MQQILNKARPHTEADDDVGGGGGGKNNDSSPSDGSDNTRALTDSDQDGTSIEKNKN